MATAVIDWHDQAVSAAFQDLFYDRLTDQEIWVFLRRRHCVPVTVNQLKTKLKILGLKRRNFTVPLEEVEAAITLSVLCCRCVVYAK